MSTVTERQIHKVNTGCGYGPEGQQITVVIEEDRGFFFDHTRGIDGMVKGIELTIYKIIWCYLHNEYDCDTFNHMSYEDRTEFTYETPRGIEHADDFVDWSDAYRLMTLKW